MDAVAGPEAWLLETARRMGPVPYTYRRPVEAPAVPPPAAWGRWLADALDRWWDEEGRPDPWTVVEVGAGDGRRAAEVLRLGPECLTALRYVLVEEDAERREHHRTRLPVEDPSLLLGPVGPPDPDDPDEDRSPVTGIGPLLASLAEPPVIDGPGLIIAVAWVSTLPSGRLERRDGRWWEVRLAADADGTALVEIPLPLGAGDRPVVTALVHDASEGARYAVLGPAAAWISSMRGRAGSGRLVVVDRWTARTEAIPPGQAPPLALDQLAVGREPLPPGLEELAVGPAAAPLSVVSWRLG